MVDRTLLTEALDPVAIAEQLGDTFIDWHLMSPINQWKRIVAMLDTLNVVIVTERTWEVEID